MPSSPTYKEVVEERLESVYFKQFSIFSTPIVKAMFNSIQQRFMARFWIVGLISSSLFGITTFQYPMQKWLEMGTPVFLGNVLGAWLCYFWSKRQPVFAAVVYMCLLILGLSALLQFPAFVAFWQLDGASRTMIAILPNVMLALLLSWRGFALGLIITLVFLTPHDTPWHFIFGVSTCLIASSIGQLFHFTLTELEKAYNKLERVAITDPLTQLGNRRAMREDYAAQHEFSMLTSWDLNGLKRINDQQGHEAGDAYILQFARCLREVIPNSKFVYRIGGDEFIGLHPSDMPPETLVSRVRIRFAGVAVGWVQLEGQPLDVALRDADRLMYINKRSLSGERRMMASN